VTSLPCRASRLAVGLAARAPARSCVTRPRAASAPARSWATRPRAASASGTAAGPGLGARRLKLDQGDHELRFR
jgi:hypothetical protein